jgi:hypothetical protein
MNAGAGAVPGAEAVYLWIGDEAVFVRCEGHPQLDESHAYDADRKVPATWMVSVLAIHMKEHAAEAAQQAAADEPADSVALAVSPLDEFGRDVVRRCLWAIDHNEGDPSDTWETPYQLAVALTMGNHLYLRGMGDGLGYAPATGMLLLLQGMTHQPANIDRWIAAIRAEVAAARAGLFKPPTELRVDE